MSQVTISIDDGALSVLFGLIAAAFDYKAQLDRIEAKLNAIQKGELEMTTQLQALQNQVKANTDVEQGAIVLIQGIAAQLAEAKDDPAAIEALAAQLKGSADSLSAAIVANTPSA